MCIECLFVVPDLVINGHCSVAGSMTMIDKLNGSNYSTQEKQIQYLLQMEKVWDILETSHPMMQGENVSLAAQQAYDEWLERDRYARLAMLVSMRADLMGQFESCHTAMKMWQNLKITFGQTSTTKLHALQLKFQQYIKDPRQNMAEHLRVMGSLIRDLQSARVALIDEQQLLGVIRSLLDPEWSQMKLFMTHNENIKTFGDISRQLELKVECIEAEHIGGNRATAFVTKVDRHEGFESKRKRQGSKASGPTPKMYHFLSRWFFQT